MAGYFVAINKDVQSYAGFMCYLKNNTCVSKLIDQKLNDF